MSKIILHVDMDAFFAAVEQREHPEYKGQPVIVGSDPQEGKGRGVVSTCSYEARKFGVRSAMPISQAWRLCPQGIYVPPNGHLYSQVSREIFDIFYEFTDQVEGLSIDEAFLDVTGSQALFGDGPTMARKIKQRIQEKEHLTASVGVAPVMYLAKIASDLEKPDGLVIVDPDHIQEFLAPLDIGRMWGAGSKTQKIFHAAGIRTFGDLAQLPETYLRRKFGKAGEHFFRLAHGFDEREISADHEVKSVSNEHTFMVDESNPERLNQTLLYLTEKVAQRLRAKKLAGKTIHLKLRYENFTTITRNKTLNSGLDSTRVLYETVSGLFSQNYEKGRAVRLLGVGVSGFGVSPAEQLDLFAPESLQTNALDQVQDAINRKFGRNAITRAETISTKKRLSGIPDIDFPDQKK